MAAVELLRPARAARSRSGPPGLRCCGRPLISNGLLDEAVAPRPAQRRAPLPLADAGRPIVACEPSCILTIKDDYPALLRGEARRQGRGRRGRVPDVRGVPGVDPGRRRGRPASPLEFRPGPRRILVQGALPSAFAGRHGADAAAAAAHPGAEVVDLDAGCCGMAGSFGYEEEHYEVSRLVGEQRLFPAVREAGPDDGRGRARASPAGSRSPTSPAATAVHPAELLRALAVKSEGACERDAERARPVFIARWSTPSRRRPPEDGGGAGCGRGCRGRRRSRPRSYRPGLGRSRS